MKSTAHKDANGEMYEVLTFENKFQEVEHTTTLHKINAIAQTYGLDPETHKGFKQAKQILKTTTK